MLVLLAVLAGAVADMTSARASDLKAYGEHLAGECTSCHRMDGKDKGIPSIVGWHEDSFIAVLQSYKAGERDNQAMVTVARSLDDEQMKALAAYFGSLRIQ
ncbi:MAG: cytochrome c [Hyphomicrobiales bacterium]